METFHESRATQAANVLAALGRRPGCLFALLLAMNALAFPYLGITLDSRLYSFQVLNHVEGGACADDLFFRFGSQDQYSLFSRVTAPVAAWLGLPWAFFLIYLLCNALLILGMQRLTQALLPNPALATLALIFLATNPLIFGGGHVFQVNEPFLTSRNIATALTLLGLERLLRGRSWTSLLLLSVGCLLHPLMAIGGLAILALWLADEYLPRRVFFTLAVAVTLAGVAVLLIPPVAGRIFGHMDAEWLVHVRFASFYNFPDEWSLSDWMQMVVPGLVVLAAAWHARHDKLLFRICWAVLLVSCGGLLATVVASRNGYTLLFQAQPYRATWLLKVLHVPLGFWLASQLWQQQRETSRWKAIGVLGLMGLTSFIPEEFILALAGLPLLVVFFRGFERKPRLADWPTRALACGLLFGLLGWGLYKAGLVFAFREPLTLRVGGIFALGQFLRALGPVFWCGAALCLASRLYRWDGFGRRSVVLALAIAVSVQGVVFLVPFTRHYRTHYRRSYEDVQFVAHVLEKRSATAGIGRPTVYWCTGLVDILWLDLGVNCYYDHLQIQGALFSRQTAVEGRRRALLVRQFEMQRFREEEVLFSDRWCELIENFYDLKRRDAAPTSADLIRLCLEADLDYVVAGQNFDGLYAKTNGGVYVYDCAQIRQSQ